MKLGKRMADERDLSPPAMLISGRYLLLVTRPPCSLKHSLSWLCNVPDCLDAAWYLVPKITRTNKKQPLEGLLMPSWHGSPQFFICRFLMCRAMSKALKGLTRQFEGLFKGLQRPLETLSQPSKSLHCFWALQGLSKGFLKGLWKALKAFKRPSKEL